MRSRPSRLGAELQEHVVVGERDSGAAYLGFHDQAAGGRAPAGANPRRRRRLWRRELTMPAILTTCVRTHTCVMCVRTHI